MANIEIRCGMCWVEDGEPEYLRPATPDEIVAEIERLQTIIGTVRREVGTLELDDAGVRMRIKLLVALPDSEQQSQDPK